MADMVLGSAQGAVDSLLGRLTSALAGEARLLSGIRGDVQFIKDEMESMNGFLMHIAETGQGESDHQVQAWIKQVADVAYRSQNYVDLYVKCIGQCTTAATQKGIGGYLRRLPKLVKTLPIRHRIATQIKELKIRAQEVGERRLRYGVEVPVNGSRDTNSMSRAPWGGDGGDGAGEEEGTMACAEVEPASFESFSLKSWITENGDDAKQQKHGMPRVIALVGDKEETARFAKVVHEDPWLTSTCSLDRNELIQLGPGYDPDLAQKIQKQLSGQRDEKSATNDHPATGYDSTTDGKKIRNHLQLLDSLLYATTTRLANFLLYVTVIIYPKTVIEDLQQQGNGQRFLLVLGDVQDTSVWDRIKFGFYHSNWSPDSAILVTTQDIQFTYPFIPYEIYVLESVRTQLHSYSNYVADFYLNNKAIAHQGTHLKPVLKEIFKRLCCQISECKLFLYALSTNPNRTQADLQSLRDNLDYESPNNHKEILKFIYKGMSISCRDCMLYLSIFPGRTTIKRARLVRRWVAEGMITKRGRLSALDEAERCFDVLIAHGCVMPSETDVTGKVKSYTIQRQVTEIARDENFVLDNLSPYLAHRLSIRSALQVQQGAQQQYATRSKVSLKKLHHIKKTSQPETDESIAIKMFFKSLPLSPQLRLLEVLDLEDCKEMGNNHLRCICDNVFKLKYLSIRRTGITELPKQLGRLLFLETLDIRQTEIKTLTKGGSVVLPKLNHLLATRHNDRRNHENKQSEESFFTVKMPKNVGAMTELQVLSHMEVSGEGDELEQIGSLHRLRKLGLVLNGCTETGSRSLFNAVGQLRTSLCTLSIEIIAKNGNQDVDIKDCYSLHILPWCLQKLEISGLVCELSLWVKQLRKLTRITLCKTLLTADDIVILGRLTSLCHLWLRRDAYNGKELIFSPGRFQNLMFLVVESSEITTISFNKAAPKLQKIVWSSSVLQLCSLSGIDGLKNVKEINLKGNFNRDELQKAAEANPNKPILQWSNDA